MREAGFCGNSADRKLPFPQHGMGAVDTALDDILVHRQSYRFTKGCLDVRYADPCHRCDLLQRKTLRQVVLNMTEHALQVRQPSLPRRRRGRCGMASQEML